MGVMSGAGWKDIWELVAKLVAEQPAFVQIAIGQGDYALELEALYILNGLCVMLSGAGRFSLGGANGPLN
jgi:hypothetical protein